MNSRIGKAVGACADELTMAATWFGLMLICAPFEICGAIVRRARAMARVFSRRRAEEPSRAMARP